jgi:hypothetical protein
MCASAYGVAARLAKGYYKNKVHWYLTHPAFMGLVTTCVRMTLKSRRDGMIIEKQFCLIIGLHYYNNISLSGA